MDYQKATLNKLKTGSNIRSLIAESAFTYEEISKMFDLSSPRVIYAWASGKKLPSIENLANLAIIFNVRIEDIIAMR